MKSIHISSAVLVTFLFLMGARAFAQTNTPTNPPQLSVDQNKVSTTSTVVDQIIVYVPDAQGNLVKTTGSNPGNKTVIKKADFDALPPEKKKFIIEDQASFIITE